MGPYSEDRQFQRATAIKRLLENNPDLDPLYQAMWKKHLNNLALNDYIQSGANERNVETYKNNLDEEVELFKTRCVKILIESHPDIFKNVINLSDKCIEDIMIPRADIDAVSVDTT